MRERQEMLKWVFVVVLILTLARVRVQEGLASQYAEGRMQEVIRNRLSWGELKNPLPDVAGFVAVKDCREIGEILLARPVDSEWLSFLIVDCAGSDEVRAWMDAKNVLIEVDYPTAVHWDTVGKLCKVEVVYLKALTRWMN